MTDELAIETAPHRVLLFRLVGGALRAEAGVRRRQAERKSTGFYAGRREGFISASAQLCSVLYGGEYEPGKQALAEGVKAAAEVTSLEDMQDPKVLEQLAIQIAEHALRAI